MPPKAKPNKDTSAASLGFEVAASRGSASESHVVRLGDISIYGQESRSEGETDEVKSARRQRPFGLAMRAPGVRLRGQQAKQSNATPRLAMTNLAINGIEADIGSQQERKPDSGFRRANRFKVTR